MVKNGLIGYFAIFFLLILSFNVLAAPSIKTINFEQGLSLEVPELARINQSVDHDIYVHVYNTTSGQPIINTTIRCYLHLYDQCGHHLFTKEQNAMISQFDFEFEISKGNFSDEGQYPFLVQCNNSVVGGYIQGAILVTNNKQLDFTSNDTTSGISVTIFVMAVMILCFYLVFRKEPLQSNPYGELIIRRGALVIVLFLAVLNLGILKDISENSNLFIPEYTDYMLLFGYAGYLAILYLIIKTLFDTLELYKLKKREKRGL